MDNRPKTTNQKTSIEALDLAGFSTKEIMKSLVRGQYQLPKTLPPKAQGNLATMTILEKSRTDLVYSSVKGINNEATNLLIQINENLKTLKESKNKFNIQEVSRDQPFLSEQAECKIEVGKYDNDAKKTIQMIQTYDQSVDKAFHNVKSALSSQNVRDIPRELLSRVRSETTLLSKQVEQLRLNGQSLLHRLNKQLRNTNDAVNAAKLGVPYTPAEKLGPGS